MGGQTSHQKEGWKEIYVVQELQKLCAETGLVNYYWVDPKIYSAENQKYLQIFQQRFQVFDSYTSVQGLKNQLEQKSQLIVKVLCAAALSEQNFAYLQNQSRVEQIFLFCHNEERAKLLMSNFSKIKDVSYEVKDCVELLMKYQSSYKKNKSILFMHENETNLLNKYRLNYHCLISMKNRYEACKIFLDFAKNIMPNEDKNIELFSKDYSLELTDKERHTQTLIWTFKKTFFWNITEEITKTTTDPRKLAYIRLPVKDMHEAIRQSYKVSKKPSSVYVVMDLTSEEHQMMQNSENSFITFTTFVKGYTNQQEAKSFFKTKGSKAYFFYVVINKRPKDPNLDFGFAVMENVKDENVVFNIYNFFQVEQVKKNRYVTLKYGALADLHLCKSKKQRAVLSRQQRQLLQNYDYLDNMMRKVTNQATVLQMAGYYKDSLKVYNNAVEELRKTNSSQEECDRYILDMAKAYKINQQYDKAEETLLSIRSAMQPIAMVYLAEIYFYNKDNTKFQQTLKKVQAMIDQIKEKDPQEGFRAANFMAIAMMKKGKFKQALKKLKTIQNQASIFYDFRYQGIPLVHDIFRNMATCEVQLKNYTQALNILNSTKNLQIVCEGNGIGVAQTQQMIEAVYTFTGQKQKVEESRKYRQSLRQSLKLTTLQAQQDYECKSRVFFDVNSSVVDIKL